MIQFNIHAVEGFCDALRQEMRIWGVGVHLVEPGFMKTGLLTSMVDGSMWDRLDEETKRV